MAKSAKIKPTFEVDKKGLAQLLARRGIEFTVLELIQNALDEKSTVVEVELRPVSGRRGLYDLTVEDNNPEGFADLTHAYTLFAESKKKYDPGTRGRFNMGEKLVVAVCQDASITTTTGTVIFTEKGRVHRRFCTDAGSIFSGTLRLTKADVKRIENAVHQVIVPRGVEMRFNDKLIANWVVKKSFEAILPTEKADKDGYLRRTKRKTEVEVYDVVFDHDDVYLYEMGIPVVPIDCRWHINICQKVPLNSDRDNVTPAYLREVQALVLNEMYNDLDREASGAVWVDDALESGNVTDEAVNAVLTGRYGEKRVITDPSDPEGTKIAVSKGYQVIQAGSFNKAQWETIRKSGAVLPAGKVTPSPKPYSDDPDAPPTKVIPEDEWTEEMWATARYAMDIANALIDDYITVKMVNTSNGFDACYRKSPNELTFNVQSLGKKWFHQVPGGSLEPVDALLIHELGHHYSMDHLSSEYHDALCRLGAKLKRLALKGLGGRDYGVR